MSEDDADTERKEHPLRFAANLLPQRMAVVRALCARCWSHSRIKDQLVKEWGCTRRTVERYIHNVQVETREDFQAHREQALADLVMQMRAHYELCMKEKQYSAAGKYFDRMMSLTGLDVRRVELTGQHGGPVRIEAEQRFDLSHATPEQLAALAELTEIPEDEAEDSGPPPTH